MILLHSNLICLGCGLSKLTLFLTTLAKRKQSQIFPQHIAPETPLQSVCDLLFFGEKTRDFFLKYLYFWHLFVKQDQTRAKKRKTNKKIKRKKEKTKLIPRNIVSIKNQMQVIPLSRNPRDKKKTEKKRKPKTCFPMCFCCFFHCSFIVFMSCHVFSLFVHCFHVCSFLFISYIFCLLKKTLPIQSISMPTHDLVLLKKKRS